MVFYIGLGINLKESVSEYKGTHKDIDIYFLPNENKYSVDALTEGVQKFNSLKNAISYIDMINRTKLNENKPNSVMSNESLVVSAGKIPDELIDKAIKLYSETSDDYDTVLDFVKDFFSQYSRVDQKDIARYIFNRINKSLTEEQVGREEKPLLCRKSQWKLGGLHKGLRRMRLSRSSRSA